MKHLEDRIKDRLEGYESSLPEGDLAEFRTLLDKSVGTGTKHKADYLVWLIPAAVAAGLAMFFILRPAPGIEPIQVIDSGAMVAQTADPVTVDDNADVIAIESKPSATHKVQHDYSLPADREEARDYADSVSRTEESSAEALTLETKDAETVSGTPADTGGSSPFVPASIRDNKKAVSVKVGSAAAGVLGGSGAIALAGLLPSMLNGNAASNASQSSPTGGNGGYEKDPEPDRRTGDDTHHMPLRAGLSLRFPFNDRWSLTTGLDYSRYSSTIRYSVSGGHKQNAYYIGIPVRTDFTIARNRWMDVYVGAGASADFCVAAFENGRRIAKDRTDFSLIGAGGVQFNISDNIGLFFDPSFSWNMPSGNNVLDTYRTEHPFMFSVSAGLRITVLNRKR